MLRRNFYQKYMQACKPSFAKPFVKNSLQAHNLLFLKNSLYQSHWEQSGKSLNFFTLCISLICKSSAEFQISLIVFSLMFPKICSPSKSTLHMVASPSQKIVILSHRFLYVLFLTGIGLSTFLYFANCSDIFPTSRTWSTIPRQYLMNCSSSFLFSLCPIRHFTYCVCMTALILSIPILCACTIEYLQFLIKVVAFY